MNLDNIRDTIQNISLYDVKAAVRKAQNVVMNYTEMESKVREATNNEPWGASSTLMQEIASGTYNYQLLNEIMPMIYKRFTEKAAEEWRQIYKALQLLEFLVKNGSEQVIDDARSHLSTIKMLRQFHFIDMNGKDQGINVRNRAKELAELLSDVDRIRQERKKARSTKNKYSGVEGGNSYGGFSGGLTGGGSGSGGPNGRRYGGFGNESLDFGGYSGGVYGDGGGFGGPPQRTGGFHDDGSGSGGNSRPDSRSQRFDEYDEYDEGVTRRTNSSSRRPPQQAAAKPPPKKPEPVEDLFSFGDDEPKPVKTTKQKQSSNILDDFGTLQSGGAEDDDFDDFQSASGPVPATAPPPLANIPSFHTAPQMTASASNISLTHPKPLSAGQAAGLSDLVGIASISPAPSAALTPSHTGGVAGFGGLGTMKPTNTAPTGYQATQPNYFTSVSANATGSVSTPLSPTSQTSTTQKKVGNDAFGSLWNSASSGIKKQSTPAAVNTPSLQAMAKEKASAGIWGAPKPTSTTQSNSGAFGSTGSTGKTGGDLDDLLG